MLNLMDFIKEMMSKKSKHKDEVEEAKCKEEADMKEAKCKEEKMEESIEEAAKVETKKYSWGTMKTVRQGSSFSIPMHPEHHEAVAKLNHGESHSFTDETGTKWKATRKNDKVHFAAQGAGNASMKATVSHQQLKEAKCKEEKMEEDSCGDTGDNPGKMTYKKFKKKIEESLNEASNIVGHSFREAGRNSQTRHKKGTFVGSSLHKHADGSETKGANIMKSHEDGTYYAAGGASTSIPKNPALRGHRSPEAAAKAYHDHATKGKKPKEEMKESVEDVHNDVHKALKNHVKNYNEGGMDADDLGRRCVKVQKMIAAKHNIPHAQAVKHVNDYVEKHAKE